MYPKPVALQVEWAEALPVDSTVEWTVATAVAVVMAGVGREGAMAERRVAVARAEVGREQSPEGTAATMAGAAIAVGGAAETAVD